MKMEIGRHLSTFAVSVGILVGASLPGTADQATVHGVFFYSPTCPHCHTAVETTIRPLMAQHGDQFRVIALNTTTPIGQSLYQAAVRSFQIPPQRRGVPTFVLGDHVLVGGDEIPARLPALVVSSLAAGGLDWPEIPGLADALSPALPSSAASAPLSEPSRPVMTPTPAQPRPTATAVPPTAIPTATALPTPASPPAEETPLASSAAEPVIPGLTFEESTWRERFVRDPLGNGLAVAVLLGMLASVLIQGRTLATPRTAPVPVQWRWAVPPLALLGLAVSGYLTYVETQGVLAICGPVGDCNTVQQSEYARLFGAVPIALLGLAGYLVLGAAYLVARRGSTPRREVAQLLMAVVAWGGILFSIYLTFLEPFVIGATCLWCLLSALLMTVLLWLLTPLVRPAVAALRSGTKGRSQGKPSARRKAPGPSR